MAPRKIDAALMLLKNKLGPTMEVVGAFKDIEEEIMRLRRELSETHRQCAFWRHAYQDECKATKFLTERWKGEAKP